jgi:adenylate cyclase
MCSNPFGGIGGRLFRMAGFKPSRKNPNLCSACCDKLPPGGAEVDIAVLFADVRGSTGLAEHSDPASFAAVMNRFYKTATAVLVTHDALIDKLIGDEVMALFIPGIAGEDYRRRAVEAGLDLLHAVGYGSKDGPWLSIGVGVNAGVAYVGNVGADGVVDFTALGDPVNVAARLQATAAPGELVASEDVDNRLGDLMPIHERRTETLRGHEQPVSVLAHSP